MIKTPQFTVLVFTRNRPAFLSRQLHYLSNAGFDFPVLIADGSDESCQGSIHDVVGRFDGRLKIHLICYGDSNPWVRIENMLEHVSTPYVVLVADDDFIVPSAVVKAVSILEKDETVSAVTGNSVLFAVKDDMVYGECGYPGIYSQRDNIDDLAERRLLDHMRYNTAITYTVRRTAQTKRNLKVVNACTYDTSFIFHFSELLDGLLTVADGKVVKMNSLFSVRQTHARMSSVLERKDELYFEQVLDDDWRKGWIQVREVLAIELVQRGIVNAKCIDHFSILLIWSYHAQTMSAKLKGCLCLPAFRSLYSPTVTDKLTWVKLASKWALTRLWCLSPHFRKIKQTVESGGLS